MSKLSEFKTSLLTLMAEYQSAHETFAAAVRGAVEYPIWCQSVAESPREIVAKLITTWFYESDEVPAGQTVQLNGVLGLPLEDMALIARCNELRDGLRVLLQEIDRYGKQGPEEEEDEEDDSTKRFPSLALEMMAELGFPRLNRRQALRHWVVVPGTLKSASFFWNRYRKTKKLTREEVQAKLDRIASYSTANATVLAEDQYVLDQTTEDQFVQVFPESIHQRVNMVVYHDGREKKLQRYAHTPVFYPARTHDRLPLLSPLPEQPQDKQYRLPVSTVTIEDQPFLRSFACHRLLPAYR